MNNCGITTFPPYLVFFQMNSNGLKVNLIVDLHYEIHSQSTYTLKSSTSGDQ